MKYLFSAWENVRKKLKTRYLYLFLDCDGTLAPIADTPDKAVIPQKTKEALESLSRLEKLRLAIISGRSLSDIKTIVGLNRIIYVGNHGLEIEGEDIASQWDTILGYRDNLADIKTQMAEECDALSGIIIEDKGISLSLHYRMASIEEEKIKAICHRITGPYESSGKVETIYGKKVIEIRPASGWNKGKIVNWLLAKERFSVKDQDILAIYVGDDQTDEDAFKALGDSGISVMVGNDIPSSAKYYVDDTGEVYKFLTMILKARSD